MGAICDLPWGPGKAEDTIYASHSSPLQVAHVSIAETCTHGQQPSFCGCHLRDRFLSHLALIVNGACFLKSHRTTANTKRLFMGTRGPSLPLDTQTQHRGSRQRNPSACPQVLTVILSLGTLTGIGALSSLGASKKKDGLDNHKYLKCSE